MKRLHIYGAGILIAAATVFVIGRLPAQDRATGVTYGTTSVSEPAASASSGNSTIIGGSSSADIKPAGDIYWRNTATYPAQSSEFTVTYGMQAGTSDPDPLQKEDHTHAQTTQHLVDKYQAAEDEDEKGKTRQELGDVITKHFEVRQQMRARELEELETQVRRLRELHERREEQKDRIVRDRLNQLIRDADGLGWGSGGSNSNAFNFNPYQPRKPGSDWYGGGYGEAAPRASQ